MFSELDGQLLKSYMDVIGKEVDVTMDRPIGTIHPKHRHIVYPINYGYIEGLLGGDGEEQDVYVLGEDEPLEKFHGVVIAVIHRFDDNECKWVAAKKGRTYTECEIVAAVRFQEQFHKGVVVM